MTALHLVEDEAGAAIEKANASAAERRATARKPRAQIPATQVHALFKVKIDREHVALKTEIATGQERRAKLDDKRERYRADVLYKEAMEIRRETDVKVDAIMWRIREIEADAQAQLDGPYADTDTLRRGQRFASAQDGSALRVELSYTSVRGLLDRAERSSANEDVPAAIVIEDEVERRVGSPTPLDEISRDEILALARGTTNPALRTDLVARSILVETTQTAEEAEFTVRQFQQKSHGGRERIHLALRRDQGV